MNASIFITLLRSLQVVTERASNARSIQQITHALPDFGSLLQIWSVLRVDAGRASNARSIQQLAHVFPDFGSLLLRSLQVVMELLGSTGAESQKPS